ncbi:hypothetical protein RQM65_12720 [Pricia sp. S334]|uniref:Uncharacterized protein n=1 Tax=Pricia mediterranea TaxID=3076079 RepID=A0ABU3L7T8_9FLAO|nr:hypothetical protein [Pricia sp. S334]MDT7829532.1 hypothetical protein [Pricia sp. S334]
MKRNVVFILMVVLLLLPLVSEAQCSMCRAVLESEGDTSTAEGINNGIVYLMAFPYIAIALLGFFVFKKMRPKAGQEI